MYPFLKSPWFISLNHTLNNFVSIIHIHAGIVNGISIFRLTIYGLKFMDLFALRYICNGNLSHLTLIKFKIMKI